MATPTVVKKIIRLKEENSSLFAWEIREQLQQQRICDPSSVPSISSINRILRNSGLWTDEMTSNQQNAAVTMAAAAAAAGASSTAADYSHSHTITYSSTTTTGAAAAATVGVAPASALNSNTVRSGSSRNMIALGYNTNSASGLSTATAALHNSVMEGTYRYNDPVMATTAAATAAAAAAASAASATAATTISCENLIKPLPKHSMLPILNNCNAVTTGAPGHSILNLHLNASEAIYSNSLPKHWFWNPSLLYYTQQQVQAANQFLPNGNSAAYFSTPTTLTTYTKSEASIDLTAPSSNEPLSDCDSGKSSPAIMNLSFATNSTNEPANSNPRKRNPYSIEELLKKPEKRKRPASPSTATTTNSMPLMMNLKFSRLAHKQTFSYMQDEDCNSSLLSTSSSNSSHISCTGEDSCDDEGRTPLQHLNTANTPSSIHNEDICETVEVVL